MTAANLNEVVNSNLIESGAVDLVGVPDILFVGLTAAAAANAVDGGVDVLLFLPLLVLLGPALLLPSLSHCKIAKNDRLWKFETFRSHISHVLLFLLRGARAAATGKIQTWAGKDCRLFIKWKCLMSIDRLKI